MGCSVSNRRCFPRFGGCAGWFRFRVVLGLAGAWLGGHSGLTSRLEGAEYRAYAGCCDGSAAAVVGEGVFAAASDEDNLLRLYRRGAGGAAIRTLPLGGVLGVGFRGEADLEGAARLGDRIYWIGSHSRNKQGEVQVERQVLFATVIRGQGEEADLVPVGRPFRGLLGAMAAEVRLRDLDLTRAARLPGEAKGALNIEGLAAGPDGSLWIAFRNPVPLGRALIVPLLNPGEVVEGKPARLGDPIRLDLQGAGIRDLARAGNRYLIVAGPAEGGGRHRLLVWDGGPGSPVEVRKGFPRGFSAEAVVVDDRVGVGEAELLGDEGNESIGGRRCEDLKNPAQRSFRALTVRF